MRITIAGLCLLMFSALVWAGTLRDSFDDGNIEGWQQVFGDDSEDSVWKVVDGVLIGRRVSAWSADLVIGDATWRDYTIECDVRVTKRLANKFKDRYHYAGVIGRLRAENGIEIDSASFILNFTVPPVLERGVWFNRGPLLVFQTPFDAKLGTWYHMKATFEGNKFECYVDGKRAASFTSGAIPTGQVGLCIGGCVVEFDNVVITGDEVPDMNLSVEPADKLAATWGCLKAF